MIAPPPSRRQTRSSTRVRTSSGRPAYGRAALLAGAVLTPLLLAGCGGGAVEIDVPQLSAADRAACEELVDDLPDTLFGQERREVTPDEGVTAAWGDPAVVLTCGAPEPDDFGPFARCSEIDGVGWFMSAAQMTNTDEEITISAQSHSPRVTVVVPPEHRRTAPDSALGALSGPVTEHLEETSPCH